MQDDLFAVWIFLALTLLLMVIMAIGLWRVKNKQKEFQALKFISEGVYHHVVESSESFLTPVRTIVHFSDGRRVPLGRRVKIPFKPETRISILQRPSDGKYWIVKGV